MKRRLLVHAKKPLLTFLLLFLDGFKLKNILLDWGERLLKSILKIFFLAIIFFVIGFYLFDESESTKEQSKEYSYMGQSENREFAVPEAGVLSLIGKESNEVTELFGEPSRIDLSSFNYEWWIYDKSDESYMQVAVQNGRVVSIYALGDELDLEPFSIGQRIEQIYQTFHPEILVNVEYNDFTYQFELSEEDLGMRPLIKIGDVFAQVYVDKFTGQVTSVRFLSAEVLVLQRPYEMIYRGELPEARELSEDEWSLVERGNEQQIFAITNIVRKRFELEEVEWDEKTADVALLHSLDMHENNYFAHESPTNGNLGDRLENGEVAFRGAGENIAAKYVDGVAAFEGWLNSKGHRDTLLNEDYTFLGVGVYRNHYTQNFIIK